jgi:predicted TIM-barrel fold metal-dependent hydrolase
MQIKYGLISADSHAAFGRDDFTDRMSARKWGDRIPHVASVEHNGELIDGWTVYGEPPSGNVCNCPSLMGEPFPNWPKRWDDVPRSAYDPRERLKALDKDRVDGEVLFPNPPGATFYGYGDPEFELETVRAYNDILSEWVRTSDRYIPLAALPMLQPPAAIAQEVERAVEGGHRGVNVEFGGRGTPRGLPPLLDPYWDPIWDVCQQLGVPPHFHAAGAFVRAWGPKASSSGTWSGYTARQDHAMFTSLCPIGPSATIPLLIFSGLTQRFPNLKFVFAECGIGALNYAMAACDHEWETRRLWTEGISTRPSEIIRRQMYANFWFEDEGVKTRHDIGIENIMWESDFPHVTSYYPRSWEVIERVLDGVPMEDRRKMLYENALRVYQLEATSSHSD